MSQELFFRIALVVLSALLFANHHIFHRKPSVQGFASREKPGLIELLVALAASSWTIALVIYAIGSEWFDQFVIPLPLWLRWTGVGTMLVCVPLSQWTYVELGAHFSKKLEIRNDHRLICSGPYRFMRHPMYATLFLCAAATCLITANYVVLACVLAVVIAFSIRMKKEEALLIAHFGDEYRDYKRRTWALVPNFATLL